MPLPLGSQICAMTRLHTFVVIDAMQGSTAARCRSVEQPLSFCLRGETGKHDRLTICSSMVIGSSPIESTFYEKSAFVIRKLHSQRTSWLSNPFVDVHMTLHQASLKQELKSTPSGRRRACRAEPGQPEGQLGPCRPPGRFHTAPCLT